MKPPVQLLEHLYSLKNDDHVFAMLNGRGICNKQFLNDVKANLKALDQQEHRRYAIFCHCSYQFLVGLFAALYSGKQLAVLPNLQPGFVYAIGANIDCVITDSIDDELGLVQYRIANNVTTDQSVSLDEFDSSTARLSFFTSGSTGRPTQIDKKLSQLEQEVIVLEQLWGEELHNCVVRATVSHQHLYGFLFKILWPFCMGRLIDLNTYAYPEPLAKSINASESTVLVSSPALLNRVDPSKQLEGCEGKVKAVFSSGGPLKKEASLKVQQIINTPVYEIFGSTETGGVAYRNQLENDTPWVVLPTVSVDIDDESHCLKVSSRHLPDSQWYTMGDAIELVDGEHFYLKGRVDRIVKIEEKRLSLIELEEKINSSEWVEQSCAIVLENDRVVVGVAAELTVAGRDYLTNNGKRALNQQLNNYLKNFFEPVVLPRKWRFIEQLPINSQGKVAMSDLQALFEKAPNEITCPEIVNVSTEGKSTELALNIPKELIYFDGHFDQKPIVPGVVQIDWAVLFGRKFLDVVGDFQRLEVIKFHEFIEPNDKVGLTLAFNSERKKLSFEYSSSKGKHSSGRIVFS